jgi:hypothetical protein
MKDEVEVTRFARAMPNAAIQDSSKINRRDYQVNEFDDAL